MLYTTLRQMEYVVSVADAGGFSQAAKEISVSQPSLSVAVASVEKQIGQTLFLRRRGGTVALTPEGQAYVSRARTILAQASALESSNDSAQTQSSAPVVIGCFTDLAPLRLTGAMKSARDAAPDAAITFEVGSFRQLANDMLRGQIDLAITYDLGLDGSFERRELEMIAPSAFASATDPLAACSGVTLQDLAARPLILSDDGLSAHHMLRLFRDHKLNPRIVHRAASLEAMRSLAAAGEGIGVSYSVPPTMVAYDGTPLATVPVIDDAAKEPIVLARTALAPPSHAVTAIWDAIAGHAQLARPR